MKTNDWNQTPLFKFLPFFLAGIIFVVYAKVTNLNLILWLSVVPFLFVSVHYFFSRKINVYRFRWVFGLCSYLLTFLAASILTILNTETNYPQHFSHYDGAQYIGYFETEMRDKPKSFRATIQITSVKVGDDWKPATGSCLVYIKKDSSSSQLNYGDMILFDAKPVDVLPPANPSQFDYKRWLGFNKIFQQVYIPSDKWKLLAHHRGWSLTEYALTLREKLLSVFRENNIAGQDYAVLSALILGYTDEIDQEIINAYSASGALHVLSVSGLHVGIVFIALEFMLRFLDRSRRTRLFKFIIIIIFLWFYALLTGLSPAVLRSAAMLSFVVIGKMRKQRTNMYNTLSASAMFLLALNPYLIMQVGFQLSYLAVFGIVFLQPKIYEWYDAPNKFLRAVWALVAVSLAAQTATFPLALLYFHQFPMYFLISNLIIIPISNIIIYGGIILLLVSKFSLVAKIIAWCVGALVHFVNWIVISIGNLPMALLRGISISVFETWLIYFLILGFVFYLLSKESRYVFAALSFTVFLLAMEIAESFELKNQKLMVVYSVPKKTALAIIDDKKTFFLSDTDLIKNKSMMLFNIYHHWWDRGLDEEESFSENDSVLFSVKNNFLGEKNDLLQFDGKKILVLKDVVLIKKSFSKKLKLDFLILSGNLKASLSQLSEKFDTKQIIIDSSSPPYKAKKWAKEAKQLHITCHSVLQNGAYIYTAK